MARTSQTVTEQEILAYVKFCKDNNIVNDDSGDPETVANAELVLNYFLETWKADMTEANFALAFPQLRSQLKFYSSTQHAEYTHLANENRQAVQQLSAWLATQGKPGQLVNQGDQAYENVSLLLTALSGRDINPTSIAHAEDRIAHRPGRQLHRVPQPRRSEPQSPAAKADDSTSANWLGRDLVKNADGSYRSKAVAEQRRDAEAVERAKSQPHTPQAEPTAWETLCNQLRDYGTRHSQRAAMRETYDRGIANGKSWREIYSEMTLLKRQYETTHSSFVPSINARNI